MAPGPTDSARQGSDELRPLQRTRYFEVYLHGTTAGAHQALLQRLDAGAERVAAALGRPFPAPTRLIIAGSLEHFNAALPSGVRLPPTVMGVALADHGLIILRNAPELARTFIHEASHIALLAATAPKRPPRWFIEGFAAYQAEESTLSRLGSLTRASVSGTLIPLRELEDYFPLHGDTSELAYAQSNEMVTHLLGTYGAPRFHDLVGRLARGEPFFSALERTYGQPMSKLEAAYVQDLRVRYNWVPIITGTVTLYLGMTLIFLLAYWRKRRLIRRRLAQMTDEDVAEDDLLAPYPLPTPEGFDDTPCEPIDAAPPKGADDHAPPRPPTLH